MRSALDGVEVLERLDLSRLRYCNRWIADLVVFRSEEGDWDGVDRVDWVERAFSVARVGPVVYILLEPLGFSGLHRVVLHLQTVGLVGALTLCPRAQIRREFRADFGDVRFPGRRVARRVDANAVQGILDVAG